MILWSLFIVIWLKKAEKGERMRERGEREGERGVINRRGVTRRAESVHFMTTPFYFVQREQESH